MTVITSWCPKCEKEEDLSSLRIDETGIQRAFMCGYSDRHAKSFQSSTVLVRTNSAYPGYIALPMKGLMLHKTKEEALEEAKKIVKSEESEDPVGAFVVTVVDWVIQE